MHIRIYVSSSRHGKSTKFRVTGPCHGELLSYQVPQLRTLGLKVWSFFIPQMFLYLFHHMHSSRLPAYSTQVVAGMADSRLLISDMPIRNSNIPGL